MSAQLSMLIRLEDQLGFKRTVRVMYVYVTPSDISKTIWVMYVICGTVIAHDPKMCPIVFGRDVMHINEGAGLNVKIWKCSYFNNSLSVLFHIWYSHVVS